MMVKTYATGRISSSELISRLFEVYGAEFDGPTTKLGSWSTINKDTQRYHDQWQLSQLVKIPTDERYQQSLILRS